MYYTLVEYYQAASVWLDPIFLIYFSIINIIYIVLLLLGTTTIYKRQKELNVEDFTSILRSNSLPEISFIVPTYNRGPNIVDVVENLLNLSYRYKQIIIVNDGSEDDTLNILQNKYQLLRIEGFYKEALPTKPVRGVYQSISHPELIVIDKVNGEKYDALNAALNICKNPYFITVDADTFIDDEGFKTIIPELLFSPQTIATGASVRILNGCILNYNRINTLKFPLDYISAMQSIEYLRAFLMRQGWKFVGGEYVLSGAFSVFATDVIKKAGGYAPTVANDLEIIIRLNRMMKDAKMPYNIEYLADPVAWTEAPSTFAHLSNQRMLWHRGLLESLWFHKCLFMNPKYGAYGWFVFPFVFFGEAIEPLVELAGIVYIVLGLFLSIVNPIFILLFFCITWGFTFIYTLFCLMIEDLTFKKYPSIKSMFLLFYYSLLENLGYRQLTIFWRLRGFKSFFKRFKKIAKDSKKLNTSITDKIC